MLYNLLKILHIISATLLVTSMAYSCYLWRYMHSPRINAIIADRIQVQTWLIIIPVAIVQLMTGFSMISLQNEDLSQFWIIGSSVGFIILIGSWFSFIYFLLLAQQVTVEAGVLSQTSDRYKFCRRIQSLMLALSGAALLSMVFFMVSKTA